MSKVLAVKNWSKFQHYRDRCPPWIKLATDTFQNPEFARLQDASKLLAICIWTLASKTKDGTVPHDFPYIKQWGFLSDSVTIQHFNELITKGFILDASNMLAECKQDASAETEERQRERDKEPSIFPRTENGGKRQDAFEVKRKLQELAKARGMQ